MNAAELLEVQYQNLPALDILRATANWILGLALPLWLGIELSKLRHSPSCDLLTPILRIGFATAVVNSIPWIGALLTEIGQVISTSMFERSSVELLERSFQNAIGSIGEQSTLESLTSIFSFKTILALASSSFYVLLIITKYLIIDILQPLAFGLVLFLGILAVPISSLPGLGSLSGWARSLIEIALWPVVFQLLVGLLAATFPVLISEFADLNIQEVMDDAILQANDGPHLHTDTGLLTLMKFYALSLGYVCLTLATPLVAAITMRSSAAGLLGSLVVAQVVGAGTYLWKTKFDKVGAAYLSRSPASTPSPQNSGALTFIPEDARRHNEGSDLNTRQYSKMPDPNSNIWQGSSK